MSEVQKKKSKIMVIDDSNTIRRSAELFLKQIGDYEVVLVEDGYDAMAKIVESPPDIIFVDIMMPKLNGYDTCQMIKRNKKFKEIPIIMLSSKDGLFDKAKGRLVGSNEYLTKPFKRDDLASVLKKYVK